MTIINKQNLILIIIIAAVLAFTGGCRNKEAAAGQENTGQEAVIEQIEGDIPGEEESAAEEDIQGGEQEEEESSEEAEDSKEEKAAEEVEIPEEITAEMEEADSYFNDGMYAEAVRGYRDAQRALEDSGLAAGKKEELLGSMDKNYKEAADIIEIAKMHHGNAMTLGYEKRFEEAKAELEAALAIYPKYQTAIDALNSLEALMGLK